MRETIAPHFDTWDRISIKGPPAMISSQQAVGLSLALYELATNALKYGALSISGGQVAISWTAGLDQDFEFPWEESDGPTVREPVRSGFGSRLTNKIVPAYFSGTGITRFNPNGVAYQLKGTISVSLDDIMPLDQSTV